MDDAIAYNLCPHCRAIGVNWANHKIKTEKLWDADIKEYWDKDYYQCPYCHQEITNIASIDEIGTSLGVDDLDMVDEVLKLITEFPDRYPPGQWFVAGTIINDDGVTTNDPEKIVLNIALDIGDNDLYWEGINLPLSHILSDKQRLEKNVVTQKLQAIFSQYREGWNIGLQSVVDSSDWPRYQKMGYQNAKETLAIESC